MAVRAHPQSKSMKVTDLVPAEYNPRTIGESAMKGLTASIERFGLVHPVIWNKSRFALSRTRKSSRGKTRVDHFLS